MKNDTTFQFRARTEAMRVALAEAGFSDTRARRAVVGALCETPNGLTPARLLRRGRTRHARLGYVTVYRTLDILERLGLARRLHQQDGCSTYAVASGGHGHHVICRLCHKAVEWNGCVAEDVLRHVAAATGYSVDGHWLEVFGVCPSCRAKGKKG
jgi:Fe2+ or Zn2+ uptake regulation protein